MQIHPTHRRLIGAVPVLAIVALLLGPRDLLASRTGPAAGGSGDAPPRPASVDTAENAPHGDHLDVQVLGGLTTFLQGDVSLSDASRDRPHFFYGGLAHVRASGWGALALGELGHGRGYDSRLLGGGLSRRVVTGGPVRLSLFGGWAHYSETTVGDRDRSTGAPLYGLAASLDLGSVLLSLTFHDLWGRYDGADVPESFRFHVPRLAIGIGF